MTAKKQKNLSHKEIFSKIQKENAAKGGRAVFEKYGKEYMSKLSKDGWMTRKAGK